MFLALALRNFNVSDYGFSLAALHKDGKLMYLKCVIVLFRDIAQARKFYDLCHQAKKCLKFGQILFLKFLRTRHTNWKITD